MFNPLDVVSRAQIIQQMVHDKLIRRPKANFRQITHLFWPYSQNTIINSEYKRLFCRVEDGDVQWRLYRLPVVTGEQSPGRW